jgi:hypothetical protein
MLEAVSQDAKRKGLDVRDRIVPTGSAGQHTWKVRNLGDPTPIVLPVQLDLEVHWLAEI